MLVVKGHVLEIVHKISSSFINILIFNYWLISADHIETDAWGGFLMIVVYTGENCIFLASWLVRIPD
jgi:hypothetical protein